jgi:hypothetical protein
MNTNPANRVVFRVAQSGFAACLVAVSAAGTAKADPTQNLFIGGGQYSSSSQYVYLGDITPIAGGSLGKGLFVSPFVSWSRYTFQKNGTEFTGSQPAASLGFGYAWTTKPLSVSLSLAGGYSNTSVSPFAPSGSFHGPQWFAEPEIYAQAHLPAGITVTGNGGYLTGSRDFWVTTYAMVPVTAALSIGPEADLGGGINYRNHTIALRLADQLTPRLAFTVSGGATTDVPGSYHPYVGMGLSVPFP